MTISINPRLRRLSTHRRLLAFIYTTCALVGIAYAAYWFATASQQSGILANQGVRDALTGAWFAMLGGVGISYKGIFDHRTPSEWAGGWMLWYIGRPFASSIVGVLTFSLLQVANTHAEPSIPVLAIVAFTFGTQEKRFFAFLYQVAQLVLSTPKDQQPGLQVSSFAPESGTAGGVLMIQGSGFQSGTKVTVGDAPLTHVVPSGDGASLAGVLPAGNGVVDVVVINPDNTAQQAAKRFTYETTPPPAA
jgi:IPT/TIG domain